VDWLSRPLPLSADFCRNLKFLQKFAESGTLSAEICRNLKFLQRSAEGDRDPSSTPSLQRKPYVVSPQ
jgi:hypothetical protein